MFKNYFITAWRNLIRNKAFSFINVFGLALGLACSLLIFLWVRDERNIDTFNTNKDIFVVNETTYSRGVPATGYGTPGLLAAELKRNIPEIQYASSFWNMDGGMFFSEMLFSEGDKRISLKGCHADSDYFKMFSYPLLEGTAASALATPDAIALSKNTAIAFFGSPAAAIGKTIRCNNAEDFRVTTVFDIPANASQEFDFALNWFHQLSSETWLKEWIYRAPYTFIGLRQGADPAKVQVKIKNFIAPYLSQTDREAYRPELGLQRFDEAYLNNVFKNGVPAGGRIEYVRLLSIVAVFILLIACINFMNLATARSVKRAKEVGIRKTIGALRWKLVAQFIGEAMLLTFLAIAIALITVKIALPYFNMLTGKHIVLPLASPSFWLIILALLTVTGFTAGSYPAIFLSSLNPIKVLKGSLKFSNGALLFRKGLVVFQFMLSIVMITATIVISKQLQYVQTANLGYDRQNLVYIPLQGDLLNKYEVFKQELLNTPGVQGVTRSTNAPANINTHAYDLDWEGRNINDKVSVIHNGVGYDFLPILDIPLVQGRNFSRDFPTDSNAYIINETALKMLGYKDPIGKPLGIFQNKGTIVGVVKDFHLISLRKSIMPLVLYLGENETWGYTLVKIQPGKTQQAIAGMQSVFKKLEPGFVFKYNVVDEEYRKSYNSEITVNKLSDGFSFLAIFISCLGLLGLTMFTVEQRRKEIGVRKVIGAGISDIVVMLSKDIIKLIVLAAIIATPVAWLAMSKWLQNFAYRTNISWWIFITAGALALLIALLTISWQAVKAAMANPVKSLRTEY